MDELEQPADQLDSGAAAAAAEDHDQAAEQHDSQTDEVSQEEAEEDEEIEIGGRKLAMPKSVAAEIKAGTMRNADYTQKTQAVAEERRQVEAAREQVRQQAEQSQQFIKEVAKVHALDDQLEQFRQVDWGTLIDQDPVGAQKLQMQYQTLQQQRQQAAEAVTQKQQQHALEEQRTLATQYQEAEAFAQREIPGWNQETAQKLNSYAASQGIKVDQNFAKLMIQQPALIKLIHQASMFGQLKEKQATKPQAPAAPPPPVQRVGAARASAKPDPAKMPTADWMEQRNKQLRTKR